MTREAHFNGSEEEANRLLRSVANNCACVVTGDKKITSVCEAHKAIATDQRFLDGLLYSRQMRGQLIKEEFTNHKSRG